jgi:hypothetical protein
MQLFETNRMVVHMTYGNITFVHETQFSSELTILVMLFSAYYFNFVQAFSYCKPACNNRYSTNDK